MTRPPLWPVLAFLGAFLLFAPARSGDTPASATPKAPERTRVGVLGIQIGSDGTVQNVFPGGAAAEAGLQVGDLVLTLDGKPAAGPDALREALKGSADRAVTIQLRRKDQEMEIRATPKGRWMDSPEIQKDPLLGEVRKTQDPAEQAVLFRKFAAAHPGTDLASLAEAEAVHREAKVGSLTPESLAEAVKAWVKALPPEHEFRGELAGFWTDCKAVSGEKADLKAWLASLDALAASAGEDGLRAECKLAAALAARDAGDDGAALAYAEGLQKAFPDSPAAKKAGDLAYELKVLSTGKPAPDFKVPSLDGKGEICLSALKGRPVLVDAWASWCGPCKAALPSLLAIHGEYSGKGLQVISLSLDEPKTKAKAEEEVAKLSLPWPQGWDKEAFAGTYAKAYQVRAIPNYLLVDAEGRIVGHWVGFDEEGIRRALAGLFPAEAASGKP